MAVAAAPGERATSSEGNPARKESMAHNEGMGRIHAGLKARLTDLHTDLRAYARGEIQMARGLDEPHVSRAEELADLYRQAAAQCDRVKGVLEEIEELDAKPLD